MRIVYQVGEGDVDRGLCIRWVKEMTVIILRFVYRVGERDDSYHEHCVSGG